MAFGVRILPLKYGAYLSEFDPYWHFYVTEKIVNDGPLSVYGWVDTRTWYPFGRVVDASTPMGLPYAVATFYFLLRSVGAQMTLMDVAIFFPPAMAAVSSIAVYFLGKEVAGREAGLLAAVLLALNEAYISRTALGFLKHETVGVLAIVLVSLFFLKAVKAGADTRRMFGYAALAGLALAYLNISWGASFYVIGLLPLFVVVMVILRQYTTRLLLAYSITVGLGLLLMLPHPRSGPDVIQTSLVLPVLAGFVILAGAEVMSSFRTYRPKMLHLLVVAVVLAVGVGALSLTPAFAPVTGKFMAVLNPALRVGPEAAIVGSVAEHRVSTWATFYAQFGNSLFLGLVGIVFALKRRKEADVFILVAGLTAVYFSASFIRLTLIMAPMFAVLAGYGFSELAKPFAGLLKDQAAISRVKGAVRVMPKLGVVFVLVTVLILVPSFASAVNAADTPTTIASSSAPVRSFRGDWLEALKWIDENVPKGQPVVAWWDYGYWIAIGGNSTSVADNATLNTTQIAHIGQVLLSPEPVAVELAKKYFNAEYILIYVTTAPTQQGHVPWGFGDEGKWVFMADIAQGYHPEISRESVDVNGDQVPDADTLMGK
ncbi:MAG: STT3 domain-containing protein, partial [Candidatus Bathyarchaeia archaeon]